jgi:hypothetical protein
MKAYPGHPMAIATILCCGMILLGAALPGAATAQPLQRTAHCTWTEPTSLSAPVDYYQLETERWIGTVVLERKFYDRIEGESFDVFVTYGFLYHFKVRAVDVEGRIGEWSAFSPPYAPEAKLADHVED